MGSMRSCVPVRLAAIRRDKRSEMIMGCGVTDTGVESTRGCLS